MTFSNWYVVKLMMKYVFMGSNLSKALKSADLVDVAAAVRLHHLAAVPVQRPVRAADEFGRLGLAVLIAEPAMMWWSGDKSSRLHFPTRAVPVPGQRNTLTSLPPLCCWAAVCKD